jgi:transketolase
MSTGMRERFTEVVSDALDDDSRLAVVLADIGVARFEETGAAARHPDRVLNVGIREQLLISVAAGLALEGMRPVVHSYTPFLVERPFEQVKLDLGHQDVGAVLVSIGASYDAAAEGRTHQSPADVSLLASLPGWTIHVPGHADEVELLLRHAIETDDRVYIRLSEETNAAAHGDGSLHVVREAGASAPLVLAVGPTLDPVLAATADRDIAVAYTATVRPLDGAALRAAARGADVVLVEPTLAGTSTAVVADALRNRPHRLLALGVENVELRRYGSGADHRAAHGLDAAGIRRSLDELLAA